jgi:hypothetical protein
MGQKITTEDEARRCLRAAKAAGQTPGEWARAHGIDGRSLNMFRVNLDRRSRSTAVCADKCIVAQVICLFG